jgi:hypothetical protein
VPLAFSCVISFTLERQSRGRKIVSENARRK